MATPEPNFKETRLRQDERPRAYYEFYANGRGIFPVDMLRSDQCWPANGDAAAFLLEKGQRSIKLHSWHEPTPGRWSSFLWPISALPIYRSVI